MLLRGINPSQILDSNLWWEGPEFLHSDETHWPKNEFQILEDDMLEKRAVLVAVTASETSIVSDLLARHSNLDKVPHFILRLQVL